MCRLLVDSLFITTRTSLVRAVLPTGRDPTDPIATCKVDLQGRFSFLKCFDLVYGEELISEFLTG